jgi:hypothetical protein
MRAEAILSPMQTSASSSIEVSVLDDMVPDLALEG